MQNETGKLISKLFCTAYCFFCWCVYKNMYSTVQKFGDKIVIMLLKVVSYDHQDCILIKKYSETLLQFKIHCSINNLILM